MEEVKLMNGLGQNFDDFMVEQGLYDEAKELAAKKLIAHELKQEMEAQKLSKTIVAKKMNTSRVSIDNILNPSHNTSIGTLERFAAVLGKKLSISLR
jgi:predicted XRE-type DNA-binding protein